MDKFKYFLLNEEKSYLGHRVGDVLTSIQDLTDDIQNLGSRHLAKLAEDIVNQIRKIIHTNWNPKYQSHLKELQKIGVAIQKTIDDKGNLTEILPAALQALQDLSGKLGVKVNSLSAPELPGQDVSMGDFQATPPNPQQPPAAPQMPPAPQPAPQAM